MKEFIEKLIGRLEEEKQRLRNLKNNCVALSDHEVIAIEEGAYNFCKNIVNELAEEYNNAEEQGLLLRLPCKVGDKVYQIEDGYIYEFNARSIDVRKENEEYIFCIDSMDYKMDDFGKTVFLTKEEAEQALKQMGE